MKNIKNNWHKFVPLILAGIFLFFAFRGLNWAEMLDALRNTHFEFLLLAFFIEFFSFFTRSLRWRLLLNIGKPISVKNVFWATMTGYLGNNLLPARAGELIRTWALGNKTGLSKTFIFGTILVERGMDVIFLVLISFISLGTFNNFPDWMSNAVKSLAVLGFIFLFVVLFAFRMERIIILIINKLPLLSEMMRKKMINSAQNLLTGMSAFQNLRNLNGFIFLTFVAWGIDSIFAIQIATALNLSLTFFQTLIVLAALGLSSAIPINAWLYWNLPICRG